MAAGWQRKLPEIEGFTGQICYESHEALGFFVVRLTRLADVVFCYQARSIETGEMLGPVHANSLFQAVADGWRAHEARVAVGAYYAAVSCSFQSQRKGVL